MRRRWLALAAAIVGTALVFYALLSKPTDEERIVEQLAKLEGLLSYDSPPNLLQRTARLMGGFEDLMTSKVRVEVPERGFEAQGRSELARLAASATARLTSFRVSFTSPAIEVDGQAATVQLDVEVEAEQGSEVRRNSRQANLLFVKSDGDWLLERATVRESSNY